MKLIFFVDNLDVNHSHCDVTITSQSCNQIVKYIVRIILRIEILKPKNFIKLNTILKNKTLSTFIVIT